MKLINTFHNTECTVRKSVRELQEIEAVAFTSTWPDEKNKAQAYIRRIRNKLCGTAGCTCGGTFGERPAYTSQAREE